MHSIEHLIDLALSEDIGSGDITTDNTIHTELQGAGIIVAKESCVLAGINIAEKVFRKLDDNVCFVENYKDGEIISKGETIIEMHGEMRALLKGERTALNFLQRLSGIATLVRSYVDLISDKKVRIVDTRKTTPGWRAIEKYAVRVGGAYNHRMGLYDGILIKDNHIKACGGITNAVKQIKQSAHHLLKIEVETSNLVEVEEALKVGVDVIMFDNMDIETIKKAVKLVNGRVLTEVSGNVTIERLNILSDTGVDIISIGALTHSAKAIDLSMRIK
ncbi:MAG: carboxylating nicotinate-nucleotide diphosphorylase [Desulfobacterales bacterium]|nr:carboxylating nicotinate-nucleotide diphosphorylase [Desulfobacterales bacterium]